MNTNEEEKETVPKGKVGRGFKASDIKSIDKSNIKAEKLITRFEDNNKKSEEQTNYLTL